MGIELKHSLRQSQNLLLSPQIQQAIKILTLGRLELQEYVAEELKENPCLEELVEGPSHEMPQVETRSRDDVRESQTMGREEGTASPLSENETTLADLGQALISAADPTQDSFSGQSAMAEPDVPFYDRCSESNKSLHVDVEKQLRMMHLTEHELLCAVILIQYLDDDGYLIDSLEEVSSENDLNLDDCAFGLSLIQKCEPSGIGARDIQECLLLQLRSRAEIPALSDRIIRDYWTELQKADIKRIARGLKATEDEVKDAITFIRNELDPRPARQFGDSQNSIVEPDVFIFQRDGKWVVSLNQDGLPRLKVSKKYEKLVAQVGRNGRSPQQTELKTFVTLKVRSATWLVRALAERNKTILRVAEVIAERQQGFFEHGLEHLRPMTLRNIAEELGLHESTISRTTSHKYVQTPRGLFELKYFFNVAMANESGEQMANETIKSWVRDMIKNEDSSKPLTDQDISDRISTEKNLKVARRTVAKYRESLGYSSSSKRVRKF